MAVLYVAEYAGLAKSEKSDSIVFQEPPLREQTSTITSASSAALVFLTQTQYVEISTDSICSIAFAAGTTKNAPAPVATVTNCRLNANERIVRRVGLTPPGTTNLADGTGAAQPILGVAVIANT